MHPAILHASMILLGIILIAAYAQMSQKLPNLDMKSSVGRSLQGLYTIGVMFLSVGLTLAILGGTSDISSTYISYFVLLLGIVLTTLAGILVNGTDGTVKNWAIMILVLGLLFIVGTGFVLAKEYKQKMSFGYCSL
jgi:hypothetical protein